MAVWCFPKRENPGWGAGVSLGKLMGGCFYVERPLGAGRPMVPLTWAWATSVPIGFSVRSHVTTGASAPSVALVVLEKKREDMGPCSGGSPKIFLADV